MNNKSRVLVLTLVGLLIALALALYGIFVAMGGFGAPEKIGSDAQGAYYRKGYPTDNLIRTSMPVYNPESTSWCNICTAVNYSNSIIGRTDTYQHESTVLHWLGFPELNQDWINYTYNQVQPISPYVTSFSFAQGGGNGGGGGGGNWSEQTIPITPVPEPNTWAMLTAGIALVLWRIRR